MNKNGPVVVIEYDDYDQYMLNEIFKKLDYKNDIFKKRCNAELDYLNKIDINPFLIRSDINMPKINGFELRSKIHENEQLNVKYIPYLFFTTASTKTIVAEAYSLSVQNFLLSTIVLASLNLQ